ncbi:MAG TPA: prepilin-type N-terminal cleavage/methylation domain-containing protein [Gemmatimonadaceae bacterium]|nr:prepilin-type N-terminal cleavage/methylation domain-containing protein [Gemmatimonadaceae bacterium]
MRLTWSRSKQRKPRGASRRGFTLAELLVALTLFGIVMAGIVTVLQRQQRFYRSANDLMSVRGQLRQGESVLPFDLRWISTSDTTVNGLGLKFNADVYARDDHTFDFRKVIGSSVLCGIKSTTSVALVPRGVSGTPVTTFSTTPVVGDSLLILDEGLTPGQVDDVWRAYGIASVSVATGAAGCPFGTGNMIAAADTGHNSIIVSIAPAALSGTIAQNAPVRVFRRARYQLYKASDNRWYLGYADCLSSYTTASKCSNATPVAGPFTGYQNGNGTPDGLNFTYYDSTGSAISSGGQSASIARIRVILRGKTRSGVDLSGQGGRQTAQRLDSVVLAIGVRNRR